MAPRQTGELFNCGHPRTDENTYRVKRVNHSGKQQRCLECNRQRQRRRYASRRHPTTPIPVHERVVAKLDRSGGPDECWTWTGKLDVQRYGYISLGVQQGGRRRSVHRVMYEHFIGLVPAGLELDHICHPIDGSCPGGKACLHRRCANPQHLQPTKKGENSRRQVGWRADVFACGHPRDEEHTYVRPDTKVPVCRVCRAQQLRQWRINKHFTETGEVVPGTIVSRGRRLVVS